jgi:mitochondrial enoyl-[acyl-carrier protein] reductase / trans-2-enoyl-CoA reductase
MKQVLIDGYGAPEEVARCADVPDVGAPGAGEVVFDVLAFPINPADISLCRGTYRLKPPLPATPGAECVGRVAAVGAGVGHVKPGDLVINLQRENWAQRRRVKGDDVIPIPPGMDLRQAAMLRINPPTALLMLTDIVALKPGDWVIQNVANSAVGRLVIRLAAARGVRTMNVVRRDALFAELKALGADACVVDGPDLAEAVKAQTGGAPVRLGLDAVSGRATARLSTCLGDGGVVCTYGSMSGEDPVMLRSTLANAGQTLVGFTLGRGLATRSLEQVRAMYADLGRQVLDGTLTAPVEKIYPIEDIKTALAHAQRGARNGKILVTPNGAV